MSHNNSEANLNRQADRQADRMTDGQDHVLSQADALTKKKNTFLAQILTELELFENKENIWKFCIEHLWKSGTQVFTKIENFSNSSMDPVKAIWKQRKYLKVLYQTSLKKYT